MWRLMHLLFGWDYIAWRNSADQGVARVHLDGLGRVWYWRYRSASLADFIREPNQVLWLTCSPWKNFNIRTTPLCTSPAPSAHRQPHATPW